MSTISQELRQVLSRRIEQAGPREIITIAGALCDDGIAASVRPQAVTGNRFHVDGDVVHDALPGLTWSRKTTVAKRCDWKAAKAACEAVTLGGFTDWRMPTIRELLTLVDYERHSPAIDTSVFECESAWYWASTPYAPAPAEYAWGVSFSFGYAGCNGRDGYGFVRAVRGGQ